VSESVGKLTLADIARLAGVGVGTASRALNDSPSVAPATRARVLAMAEKYHYVISPDASRLARGTTGRVAVVVPHLSRWFFGTMVEALESVFREARIDVLLYQVGDRRDRQEFFQRLPARRKVDAVVVVGFPVEETERERLELLDVQVVAAGGQHAVYPHVSIDDHQAGEQAVGHLVSLGHRAIAMIEAVDPDQSPSPSQRSAAYYSALEEAGIPVDPRLVVRVDWGGEQGAEAMGQLLSVRNRPTSVYAHSDEVALGAIRTIRRAGLRIPEDISVVGIDDHPLAALTDLTTVRQPVWEQGRRSGELILSLLEGNPAEYSLTLPTRLVVRSTTCPPAASD
jgi:LacI family transcriptional regulator, repressor for deo operon, udp, cdd, tsx, nupC, and nupG